MDSSRGFGSTPRDKRPFGLAFAVAPPVTGLTRPRRVTRRSILQKVRRHSGPAQVPHIELRPNVSAGFQVYFTPLAGHFSPFPHGTSALSVIAST